MEKRYYKYLDYMRFLFCIAVFFYHLNLLKGGFLAVCSFFVLSGYLACYSAFHKKKFSWKEYYINRFQKIYVPLIVVVFGSLAVFSFIPNLVWVTLKPETISVLGGYNNFWQLSANLDYFARHVDSPFMHMWYIAILLQFELLFPFLFTFFRMLGNKIHKSFPCILLGILTIIFTGIFFWFSFTQNIMFIYYHSLSRVFSLFFGVFLGFIHHYYKPVISSKISTLIFSFYSVLLFLLFLFIGSDSIFLSYSMILVSFITCRMIDYGVSYSAWNHSILDKVISFISHISYEVYLVQYPVIYFLQLCNISFLFKIILTILCTFSISYYLSHFFSFDFSSVPFRNHFKDKLFHGLSYVFCSIIIAFTIYGQLVFYKSEDHTVEMKKLESQLSKNEELMLEKQKEFLQKEKQDNDLWISKLSEMDQYESGLHEYVSSLPVVGVGDSIMLGAVSNLYEQFPNGYFDAKVSRTDWEANDILRQLDLNGMLGSPVIFNLGANGFGPDSLKYEIIRSCGDRDIYWINVTNNDSVHVNEFLSSLEERFANFHIIDWNSYSQGHPEYFVADGIHLTDSGRVAYTQCIYDAIYKEYHNQFLQERERLVQEYENRKRQQIGFYGNDLLLNSYTKLHTYYPDSKFVIEKDYLFDTLFSQLKEDLEKDVLPYRLVFVFDREFSMNQDEYDALITLCDNRDVFFVQMDCSFEMSHSIPFYEEILKHPEYLMVDYIHLSDRGNDALSRMIQQYLSSSTK